MKTRTLFLISAFLVLASLLLSSCASGAASASSASGFPHVTVNNGTAYLSNGQFVRAYNTENGTQLWSYPDKGDPKKEFFGAPVLTDDGQIIVGAYDNRLYSLDASGKEKWFFQGSGRFIAAPVIINKVIYAPNADGKLYAIDSTGKELWSFTAQGALWSAPVADQKQTTLYQTSMDHNIYAIDLGNKRLSWKKDLGAAITASPAVITDTVFVGTFGSEIAALSADKGEIRWRNTVQGWVWASPVFDKGRLYVSDLVNDLNSNSSSTFYAYDAKTGGVIWKKAINGGIVAPPLVTDKAIYIGYDDGPGSTTSTVYAIDNNGTQIWKSSESIKGKIHSPFVATGNLLLVPISTGDDVLWALNIGSGAKVWTAK